MGSNRERMEEGKKGQGQGGAEIGRGREKGRIHKGQGMGREVANDHVSAGGVHPPDGSSGASSLADFP